MDLLEEKVTKKRVSISDHFTEFDDVAEVRKLVDKFGGDAYNVADVKSFILYLFLVIYFKQCAFECWTLKYQIFQNLGHVLNFLLRVQVFASWRD